MRRVARWLLIALLALVVLGALASATVYGLLGSAPGTAWLLGRVPGLTVDAPQGALIDDFAARSVSWQDGGDRIHLTGLRWRGLHLSWRHLAIASLQADTLDLAFAPSPGPTTVPTDLRLPLDVDVSELRLAALTEAGQPLVTDVLGRLHLGQQLHTVQLASLRWQKLLLSGSAELGATGQLPLEGQLALHGDAPSAELPAWQGTLALHGPLTALRAEGRIDAAAQHLQLEALLAPFANWPLAALQADAQDFDLAALLHEAPRTALSGQARLGTQSIHGGPPQLDLQVQLRNALAGRWDEHQLPVRALTLDLGGTAPTAAGPHRLALRSLQLELGTRGQAAGTLAGTGHAQDDGRWLLDARLAALQPALLDAGLAALRLDGEVQLAGTPDGTYSVDADIAQRTAPAAAVKLQARWLPGPGGTHRLEVADARLTAGPGTATASGTMRLDAKTWALQAQLAAAHFDVRHFVQGRPDSAWAHGEHALNLTGSVDLTGSRVGLADPLAHWPQGHAHVELQASRIAGLPVQGVIDLQGEAHERQGQARLDLGGNHVGIVAHTESAGVDAKLDLDAPLLAQLAPLTDLAGLRLAGAAQGQAHLQRHGDAAPWQLDGELALKGIALDDTLRLDQAQLRWQAASALDAPLSLDATIEQAQWQDHKLDHAELTLRGTPRAQSLTLAARGEGHSLNLALDGRADVEARHWSAHIARFESPGLGSASGLDLLVSFDVHGQPIAASLAPGQLHAGPATLSWQTARWAAPLHAGAPADVALDLTLEPIDVAPLLAAQQPDMGWGGDLRVGGHASLRSLPQASADIHLERASGDLSLRDDRGTHALGLKRVAIAARQQDRHWALTADFDGSDWGQLTAQASIASDGLVPARNAALSGRLDAHVADLTSLGAWLPVGWRLGGTLTAGFTAGGSLDAPQLRGQLTGAALAARNRLLGVDVHDGRLNLELDGDQARLTQLDAQAGSGRFSAKGSARLGSAPEAQLQLEAQQLALLQRVDRRLVVSGTAGLQLAGEHLQLDGKLRVDSGLFDFSHSDAPTLSSDVYVLRPGDDTGPPPPATESNRKVRVALSVDLGDSLQLRGHGFDARLAGTLQLDQDGGPPRVTGRVRTEGGHYAAYGQKLDVTRGVVIFDGAYDNPRLDILALRPDLDQAVGVAVSGTAQTPQVRLYSDPDMSDTDKLSWLLLGRASDGLGRTDLALLQRAAVALLSGEGESSSSKLISRLGLDQLSVRQSDDSTHDTIVGIGHQLSKAWYVGYERGLNSTTGSWQLIYRLAQRLTVRAQTGDDNAIELIWQWRSRAPAGAASHAEP